MKLYYAPGACSLADHIALIEAEIEYELDKVDFKTKRTEGGEDYNTINPKGYVPALRLEDGGILTENIAILSFIGARAGPLMVRDGIEHWRTLEATAFISTEIHKSFKPLFTPGSSDGEKAQAKEAIAKRLGLFESRLGDGDGFIVRDTMSIADCYLFVMLTWAKDHARMTLPPRLNAYYERLKQRPAIVRALQEEGLG